MKFLAYMFSFLAFTLAPAYAATLHVDANGYLTGASGVNINGLLYDVAFVDGACSTVLGGCDDAKDFQFSTGAGYQAAVALADQVFINGAAGNFDSEPFKIAGCGQPFTCTALIPLSLRAAFPGDPTVFAYAVQNSVVEEGDFIYFAEIPQTTDYAANTFAMFAVFTAATTAVPEPGTWAMMIIGLAGIGATLRRSRTKVARPWPYSPTT